MTIQTGSTQQFSDYIGSFTTDSSGAFGPVSVTVRQTFTTIGGQQVTCSVSQPCAVLASTDQTEQFASQPITFSTSPTTTVCASLQATKATLNARFSAIEAAVRSSTPQVEAVRAQAISSLDAQLVQAGCPRT